MPQKIVIIGGPGTGKSSILKELTKRGYHCMSEISRKITIEAQQKGTSQLFLKNPLLFSKLLLEGREQQFLEAQQSKAAFVFFDRGIPGIFAYMDYIGTKYPSVFIQKSRQYVYDKVFLLPPWEQIYTVDNERYETFEQNRQIDTFLRTSYGKLDYKPISVPFGTLIQRTNYIVNTL